MCSGPLHREQADRPRLSFSTLLLPGSGNHQPHSAMSKKGGKKGGKGKGKTAAVDQVTEELAKAVISPRTVTGTLVSHPLSRDVRNRAHLNSATRLFLSQIGITALGLTFYADQNR